jgi:hypothetical protein
MVVSSVQADCRLGSPGRAHALMGHSLAPTHGAPPFGPPRQRRPPQTPGAFPLGGQSALDVHGDALRLLHVSQKHLSPAAPEHCGLAAEVVIDFVPVVASSNVMARLPTFAPGMGRQSNDVAPNEALRPSASHGAPSL